jgi:hypothetical protein
MQIERQSGRASVTKGAVNQQGPSLSLPVIARPSPVMAIEDPAAAAGDDGGGGLGNGGMEEELMLARRMAYAASSKGELLRVIRVRTAALHLEG